MEERVAQQWRGCLKTFALPQLLYNLGFMEELILIIHFLVVLFFILGFPIGLFYNSRLFRIIHFSALAGVSLLMVLGIPCPLTILEETLRQDPVYEGSFIASWLSRVLYMEGSDPKHVLFMDLGFLTLVGSSFFWRPTRRQRDTPSGHEGK